ncbi:hypothetical protein V6N12_023872 [Hibiscus sabdariffa]|uniref:Reverse transcriptase domain-containing protein n=1 Tax=Hibiscus sabdariffa TaxID=183260 RepID=A0ABR2FZ59_9ROSI
MCDLGASINVMPLPVYNTLSADPLKETRVTVQLADRSIIYPEGVLENVLVQVNELIFPADFYVIDMENDRANTSPEILLGRPFLGTKNVKIEVRSGLLTLECNGEIVKFNVYKAMRHPENVQSINFVGKFEPAIDEFIETDFVNNLCREIEDFEEEIRKFEKSFSVNSDLFLIPSKSKISLYVFQKSKIEWKLPPEQLSKGYTLSAINSKLKKFHNRTYSGHRISLKEILSWLKRKKWRNLQGGKSAQDSSPTRGRRMPCTVAFASRSRLMAAFIPQLAADVDADVHSNRAITHLLLATTRFCQH